MHTHDVRVCLFRLQRSSHWVALEYTILYRGKFHSSTHTHTHSLTQANALIRIMFLYHIWEIWLYYCRCFQTKPAERKGMEMKAFVINRKVKQNASRKFKPSKLWILESPPKTEHSIKATRSSIVPLFIWCFYTICQHFYSFLFSCYSNLGRDEKIESNAYTATGSLNFPHCWIWNIKSPPFTYSITK